MSEEMLDMLRTELRLKGVPFLDHIYRIVCQKESGPSFWITFDSGKWVVSTWTPRAYAFPETTGVFEVANAALSILNASTSPFYDIPQLQQNEFLLVEIDVNTVFADRIVDDNDEPE